MGRMVSMALMSMALMSVALMGGLAMPAAAQPTAAKPAVSVEVDVVKAVKTATGAMVSGVVIVTNDGSEPITVGPLSVAVQTKGPKPQRKTIATSLKPAKAASSVVIAPGEEEWLSLRSDLAVNEGQTLEAGVVHTLLVKSGAIVGRGRVKFTD